MEESAPLREELATKEAELASVREQIATLEADATTLRNEADSLLADAESTREDAATWTEKAEEYERLAEEYAGPRERRFVFDQQGRMIGEYDEEGEPIREYVYFQGAPIAMVKGAQLYWYHTDHLGTPKQVTDAERNVVWDGVYRPFGAVDETTLELRQPVRFPGQYEDSGTGLYQNWHREYQKDLGRYERPDPIRLYGGMNLYSYVNGQPTRVIDRVGLIGIHESFNIPGNPNPVYPPVPINCKRDYSERVKQNWLSTQRGLPGPIGAPGVPFVTGGAVGRASVGFTVRDAVVGMYRGGLTAGAATLTRLEIVVGTAGAGTANLALATLAFESGVGIGSLIAAGVMPCQEEDVCDK